jgi:hypothetical protein
VLQDILGIGLMVNALRLIRIPSLKVSSLSRLRLGYNPMLHPLTLHVGGDHHFGAVSHLRRVFCLCNTALDETP